MQCGDCKKPSRWVRSTQFAGDHHFCEDCAKQQEDFGKSDPSSFVWERVEKTKSTNGSAPYDPRKAFERIITDVMRDVSDGWDVDIDGVVEKCMNVNPVDPSLFTPEAWDTIMDMVRNPKPAPKWLRDAVAAKHKADPGVSRCTVCGVETFGPRCARCKGEKP